MSKGEITVAEDVTYAYYPAFKRGPGLAGLPASQIEDGAAEIEALLGKLSDRIRLRGAYSAVGFRPDTDLFFWLVSTDPDAFQDFVAGLRRTTIGAHLELTYAFLGAHRPPEFNPDHIPSFMRDVPPGKYASVYPFVRTVDWYLLDPKERGEMLREHGIAGREFTDVLPNTTSAFGLGDWEWILAFESDRLERIVDCIRALRDVEARRYTKLDVPFIVGIRKEVAEVVRDLA